MSFLTDSFDDETKRLPGGPFINDLASHYDVVADNTTKLSERKVLIYSCHDTTITYVLNTLGVFNGLAPPYASLVIYLDGWKVRSSYRNDTNLDPYVLTIPGCHELCPLDLFKQLTSKVRPEDWVAECRVGWTNIIHRTVGMEEMDNYLLMVARLTVCMAVVIICPMAVMLCWRMKNTATRYGLYQRI